MSAPLLSVKNLQKYFPTSKNVGFRKEKLQVKAVDGIDLTKFAPPIEKPAGAKSAHF